VVFTAVRLRTPFF